MEGAFYLVKDRSELDHAINSFAKLASDWDFTQPLAWKPVAYVSPRTFSQNALVHVWFSEMATHFARKVDIDAEGMKMLMKNMFLGTEDITVGSTVIPGQVRSTSKLDKGEMMHFLDNIYAWAVDHGVKLTNPNDSEWMRLKNG